MNYKYYLKKGNEIIALEDKWGSDGFRFLKLGYFSKRLKEKYPGYKIIVRN